MSANNGVSYSIKTITPTEAQAILDKNGANRSISWDRVARYAEDMIGGKWQENGQPIIIARGGRLLDGQHRLHACIQAKKPIQMLVVSGVDEGAMESIDTGRSRRSADLLAINGFKDPNRIAAIIGVVRNFERGVMHLCLQNQTTPSPSQCIRWAMDNPSIYEVVRVNSNQLVPLGCSTIGGALTWLFHKHAEKKADRLLFDTFVRQLATGLELTAESPVFMLRRRVEKGALNPPKTRRERAAVFIKAWNLYRSGDTVSVLRFRDHGSTVEPFPTISGLVYPA